MLFDLEIINKINDIYGNPFYVFDEQGFIENYKHLERAFRNIYPKYQIAYSFKTNYTPYIVRTVKNLGGYAEVVSGMEYYIAKKIGFKDDNIIFNGPNKGNEGIEAFLNGSMIQVDNFREAKELTKVAQNYKDREFEVAIRVNADIGQNFISRFGVDVEELPLFLDIFKQSSNVKVVGLHCHISRCRGLDMWKARAENMLTYADSYFDYPLKYINLGSGMFGKMDQEFASQFDNAPTYEEYAEVVATLFKEHYKNLSEEEKPLLITEPGTTLINKYVDFVGRVDVIKKIKNKWFAVLNCSEHNLGETCTLKDLPLKVIKNSTQKYYENIDFSGYTCLEQDIMRKNVNCELGEGDYVVFGNVGGYSNVLKPPFIWPNCPMIAKNKNNEFVLIKKKEEYDDILHTYNF